MSKAFRLVLTLIVLLPLQLARGASAADLDFAITNGHFYTQANGFAPGANSKGYSITDEGGIPFWSEFQRLGGVDELGYPISRRFEWGGFMHQATQKVVMQWRPDAKQVWFANVFDQMSAAGKDNWLLAFRQTPPAFDTKPDTGQSRDVVAQRHWKLLDGNEQIKNRYWSDSDPVNHYGLPMSYTELSNVYVVRAQRAVFQYWKVDVPWAKAGTVSVANGGDIGKEANVFPAVAVNPEQNPRDSHIRWAYYVDYDGRSLDSLKANIKNLDYVSPFYFDVDDYGNIKDNDKPEVTKLIKDNKVKILPTLRNTPQYGDFTPFMADGALRTKIINRTMELINAHGYDGINIDFEAINGEDRRLLSNFMVALSEKMRPAGKIVSMAIPAKDKETSTGWAGAYDYASLGKSNDLVLLMAYGWRTASSTTPGSPASLPWVERSVGFTVSQIPANKVLLGVSWYGYDWNKTTGPPARALRFSDAMDTAKLYGATVKYDDYEQTAYFTYTTAGQAHEVWFEEVRSFKAKIALIGKYDLAGAGGWRLGQEDPAIWPFFK